MSATPEEEPLTWALIAELAGFCFPSLLLLSGSHFTTTRDSTRSTCLPWLSRSSSGSVFRTVHRLDSHRVLASNTSSTWKTRPGTIEGSPSCLAGGALPSGACKQNDCRRSTEVEAARCVAPCLQPMFAYRPGFLSCCLVRTGSWWLLFRRGALSRATR